MSAHDLKQFPGGVLVIAGANSAAELKSQPVDGAMSATILTSAKFRGRTVRRIERELPPGGGFVLVLLLWLPLLLWWWLA